MRRLERIAILCKRGVKKLYHSNSGQVRTSNKTADAVAWMESYFETVGDHQPDCDRLHLPSFLTKREVYERMTREMKENGLRDEDIISQSQFYSVWETNFHRVMIPEVSHSFSLSLPTNSFLNISFYDM